MAEATTIEANPPATVEAPIPAKLTWDEFHTLVKQANKGDKKSLGQLRDVLNSGTYPGWLRWFRDTFGNPSEWLKSALASMATNENKLATIEASESKMEQLRRDLEGPTPTPMERLLAERAAYCWFTVSVYEAWYVQGKELSFRQAEFQIRRIDSAHKRFLSAMATLARVRKMALPVLQLNIAKNQQINMNGSQPGS